MGRLSYPKGICFAVASECRVKHFTVALSVENKFWKIGSTMEKILGDDGTLGAWCSTRFLCKGKD
eukprot:scaffold25339_cov70-Attheya_sp.AAC.2